MVLEPSIKASSEKNKLDLSKNFIALQASAGSGKTFSLVLRYLIIFFNGAKIDEILAITFTKKASSEMKQRIIESFLNLEDESQNAELEQLCEILCKTKNEIINLRNDKKEEFLNSDIKIYTFDAFFLKIAKSFSMNLGIDPCIKIEQNIYKKYTAKFYQNILKYQHIIDSAVNYIMLDESSINEFFSTINKLSCEKILDKRPKKLKNNQAKVKSLIIEIVNYCDNLINCGDEKIIKAANTLKQKLNQSYKDIIKETFMARGLNYRTYEKIYTTHLDTIFKELKFALRDYFLYIQSQKLLNLYDILQLYRDSKHEVISKLNKLDFSDITSMILDVVSNKNNLDLIYFRLDSKINHILIDEFQDTNVSQYQILLPLIEEIVAGYGQNGLGSLFYVGDIKQSIYRFRGGKKELFNKLLDDYRQIQSQYLDKNYRSHKAIVKFVNSVFKDKIDGYKEQISAKKFDNPPIECVNYLKNIPLNKNNVFGEICEDDFGYISVISSDDVLLECVSCVEKIIKMGGDINKIAILCWKNKDIDLLKELLTNKNISSFGEGDEALFENWTILAILEYAKFCLTKEDIYCLNAQSLINKGLCIDINNNKIVCTPQLKLLKLDTSKSLQDTISYIAQNLGFKLNDKNILKLIELSQNYSTLADLVFSNDTTKVEQSDNFGVNLMTIHKSKGLQFEHVIVCDNFSKSANNTDKFMVEFNDNWEIKYRCSGLENIDEEYKKFLNNTRQLDEQESINKLYVAFTRAKSSLFVVKNTKDKNSYFKVDGLLPLEDFEFGAFIKDEIKPKPEIGIAKHITLAKIEQQKVDNVSDAEIDFKTVYFGTAFHYCLEMCNQFETSETKNILIKLKNKFGNYLTHEQILRITNMLNSLFGDLRFKQILQGSKIYKEQSFKINNILKRLDLLCFKDNTFYIFDYKTSQYHNPKNEEQVKFYKDSIKQFYPQNKIYAYILYIKEHNVEWVEI